MSKLMATYYRYGLPSIFFTFAPDDIYGVLNLRLSTPQQFNTGFLATNQGFLDSIRQGATHFMDIPITNSALAAQLVKGFVAAAETFKLLCE